MFDFLLACTLALTAIGGFFVFLGSRNLKKLVDGHKVDMTAQFSEFHKFMTVSACVIICGIPLMLINVLTEGNPVTDMIAMVGIYLLLLYFILNIFNRKVILTGSGIVIITAFGSGYAISNAEFIGARSGNKGMPIRASYFTTTRGRVTVDEQMMNFHLVVAELRRRASP